MPFSLTVGLAEARIKHVEGIEVGYTILRIAFAGFVAQHLGVPCQDPPTETGQRTIDVLYLGRPVCPLFPAVGHRRPGSLSYQTSLGIARMELSPKQQIYQEMLWWTLPHLRNISAWKWWRRVHDRSARHEAALIHNLPNSMYEPEFVQHDIWFLNVQARAYCEQCSPAQSPLYAQQVARIRRLFVHVPGHLRSKLEWRGPP